MATTTNYGWTTPDDTALVKDGASAIRTLGSSVDTTTKALNPSTTLGDIEYRSSTANTNTRLGIGSTGQVLTVASGVPSWATPAGASSGPAFRAFRNSTAQSFAQNTFTKVEFNGETFDTASCFDSTTNFRFTPNVSGYYQINAAVYYDNASGTNNFLTVIYKNGAQNSGIADFTNGVAYGAASGGDIIFLNGTTDYVEVYGYASNSGTRTFLNGSSNTWFSGVWIRS